MHPLLADENLHGALVRGLRESHPDLDLVTVIEIGMSGAEDPVILEWAASQGRILLTGDVKTMPRFACDRIEAGLPMPGMFVVTHEVPLHQAIEEIIFLAEYRTDDPTEEAIIYLPLWPHL
ncbi:MAG: DUF5615 family PIN-like protein [Armatimonadetes bacterium]|nr:DUF5615 family PIN-like protein [Armatimonadota bacterium]